MNNADQQKCTVVALERRLGVWVAPQMAEKIAKRWRELGLHGVRVTPMRSPGKAAQRG